jgi:hypothetical protein
MIRTLALILILTACLAGAVGAEIVQLLNYQGVLTDGSGVAVPDNTYSITFKIYNVDVGGSELWSETRDVVISKGTFSVTLGTTIGLGGLAFNETYYIGMSVGGGPELPRQILTASPYAFTAKSALGTANTFPSSGSVGIGTLSPANPLNIRYDNTNSNSAAIAVDNNSGVAGQNLIDLRFNGVTTSRIRQAQGGDLFIGSLGASRVNLTTGGTIKVSVGTDGNVGVGEDSPEERLEVNGAVKLASTANTNAGTMRWTGSDFEGCDGATWKSFTATGSGTLPPGSLNNTLRHNGVDWAAASNLTNDGAMIGIGTTSPTRDLHIRRDENSTVGITIENRNTEASSIHRIDFTDENGTVAGIAMYDDDNPSYPSQMRLFNNRPGASLVLLSGSGSVHINNDGKIGIDVSNPTATMHVKGGNWDLNATEGDLKIGDATYRLKFGVALDGGGAGDARIFAAGGTNKLILGGGTNDVLGLDATGTVDIGSSSVSGDLRLFRSGVASKMLNAYTNAFGGNIDLFDETNDLSSILQADNAGTGGFLAIYRTTGSQGFTVDGNYAGTAEPLVTITGSSKSVSFDMDQSGTNTVVLPPSAIQSTEIADEPGAASYIEGGSTGIALTNDAYNTLASRTIVTPAAGYVLAMATCQAREMHVNGTLGFADFGVSAASSSFPVNQEVNWQLPAVVPTGTYQIPLTVHGLFTVAAGSNTFYFLGHPTSGAFYCYDFQLTLVYIPSSYGIVDPIVAGAAVGESETGGGRPLSETQVASARAESEAANAARIQRELDAMRADLEAVKARLENK